MTMERDSLVARLEPCPFCGYQTPRIISGAPGCSYVLCENCSASSDDRNLGKAVEAWNRRAAAALSRPEQVVKALEWDAEVEGDELAAAETAVGTYSIRKDGERFIVYFDRGQIFANPHDNIEAAGEAAQADCESRIRSCLTTTAPLPVAAQGGDEALRRIQQMLNTAFAAGVYDIGPPAPGTEGSRAHSQSGYARAILEIVEASLTTTAAPLQADASAPASPAIGVQAVTERLMGLIDEKLCIVWWPADKRAQFAELVSAALHPAPSSAPSPKGVSDGVRERIKTFLCVRESARADDYPWSQLNDATDILRDIEAALSQEPVSPTAEERAASKEGA